MVQKTYCRVAQNKKTADFVVKRFEERGWKAMGEKQNITLERVKEIVEMSY